MISKIAFLLGLLAFIGMSSMVDALKPFKRIGSVKGPIYRDSYVPNCFTRSICGCMAYFNKERCFRYVSCHKTPRCSDQILKGKVPYDRLGSCYLAHKAMGFSNDGRFFKLNVTFYGDDGNIGGTVLSKRTPFHNMKTLMHIMWAKYYHHDEITEIKVQSLENSC